jgi:hypothetical protein
MQDSIIPKDANLKDWGYTLLGLSIVTIAFVINLPSISKLVVEIRHYSGNWREHVPNVGVRVGQYVEGWQQVYGRSARGSLRGVTGNMTDEAFELGDQTSG